MTSDERMVRDYMARNMTKEQILDCSISVIIMNIMSGFSPFDENYGGDVGDLDEEAGDYYDTLYPYVKAVIRETERET